MAGEVTVSDALINILFCEIASQYFTRSYREQFLSGLVISKQPCPYHLEGVKEGAALVDQDCLHGEWLAISPQHGRRTIDEVNRSKAELNRFFDQIRSQDYRNAHTAKRLIV
jgi:hypothetical protein